MATPARTYPNRSLSETWSPRVAFFCLCVLGAGGLAALLLAPRFRSPAEDAVILYQYSRNLAETGRISYIANGLPAEGATDFLYMLILSLGVKAGLNPFVSSCILSAVSLVGIAALLLRFAGLRSTTAKLLCGAGVVCLFPPILAAGLGFSVLPFGLLIAALFWFAQSGRTVATGLCAFVLCLFRPDGVAFALPLMLFELYYSEKRLRTFSMFALTFVAPGILYFLWRWHYFGEFLPLPFLVKANAARVAGIFVAEAIVFGLDFFKFVLIVAAALCYGRTLERKNLRVLICMLAVPTLFYCSVRLDQNLAYRFFFYLPLAVAVLAALNWKELAPARTQAIFGLAIMWLLFFADPYKTAYRQLVGGQFARRMEISRQLAGISHQHTMLLTEAGILPYYTRWVAYDAWGLNTPMFAHHLIQPGDVRDLAPDLIQIHLGSGVDSSCLVNQSWTLPYRDRDWVHMTRNMVAGASAADYDLWRLPHESDSHKGADEGDYECWFIRRQGSDSNRIAAVLAQYGAIPEQEFLSAQRASLAAPQLQPDDRAALPARH